MSLTDENTRSGSGIMTMNDPLASPTTSQDLDPLLHSHGQFTPSPASKAPLSLQKDMRGGSGASTTTPSDMNISTFSSSASKALSSSKYTSESFQKTFSEFGQIISQRRAELSEMKKANQFRMSNQLRHDLSTPSHEAKSMSKVQYSATSAHDHGDSLHSSLNGSTPLVKEHHTAAEFLSPTSTASGGGSRLLARKLILSHQKDSSSSTTSSSSSSSTNNSSNLLEDIAAEQPPSTSTSSVVQEMAEQLQGEQQRSAELHLKISELHEMEEVQRNRALSLAQEKDKLEAVRADLLEKNASLELEQRRQQSVLDTRQGRISELEKQLAQFSATIKQWKDKFAEAEGEKSSLQRELAAHKSQACMKEDELIATNKDLIKEHNKQLSDAERRINDKDDMIIAKQKEFDEMSRDNEFLRSSMSAMEQQYAGALRSQEKAEQLHQSVSSELQSLDKQFCEMEAANKKLMDNAHDHYNQLQKAQDEVARHIQLVADANATCKEATARSEEAEAKCSHLALTLASCEQTCASQQLQLQEAVKAGRITCVTHRVKVVALLLGIWVLALAVIYEHIVDFQPTTLSPYRITS